MSELDCSGSGKEARQVRLRAAGQIAGSTTSHDPMTLEEIGKVLGVSRQRVEQIERKALAKLRQRKPRELAHLMEMTAELQRHRQGCGVVRRPPAPSCA